MYIYYYQNKHISAGPSGINSQPNTHRKQEIDLSDDELVQGVPLDNLISNSDGSENSNPEYAKVFFIFLRLYTYFFKRFYISIIKPYMRYYFERSQPVFHENHLAKLYPSAQRIDSFHILKIAAGGFLSFY